MRYQSIILFLFSFHIHSYAQTQTQQVADLKIKKKVLKIYRKQDVEGCERGLQLAMKDYYNGVLQLYTWGDGAYGDSISVCYKRILKLEYGLVLIHVGCDPYENEMCYSEWMERKIKLERGKDFFDKIWKRAEQLSQKY
jgi:hypothetical protein